MIASLSDEIAYPAAVIVALGLAAILIHSLIILHRTQNGLAFFLM